MEGKVPLAEGTQVMSILDHGLSLSISKQVEEESAQLEPKH